jgi:hypothetical protein
MFSRYKIITNKSMDWKSTFLVNTTTIGLTFTQISEVTKIAAMVVGMAWTIIQIANGINQFTDRRDRLAAIKREKKRRKDKKK